MHTIIYHHQQKTGVIPCEGSLRHMPSDRRYVLSPVCRVWLSSLTVSLSPSLSLPPPPSFSFSLATSEARCVACRPFNPATLNFFSPISRFPRCCSRQHCSGPECGYRRFFQEKFAGYAQIWLHIFRPRIIGSNVSLVRSRTTNCGFSHVKAVKGCTFAEGAARRQTLAMLFM